MKVHRYEHFLKRVIYVFLYAQFFFHFFALWKPVILKRPPCSPHTKRIVYNSASFSALWHHLAHYRVVECHSPLFKTTINIQIYMFLDMSYCRITVRQNVLTVIDRKPKPTELKILAKRESRLTYFQEKKKEVLQFDQQSKYKCIVMCSIKG